MRSFLLVGLASFATAVSLPCEDDETWAKVGDTSKHCEWVGILPEKRCTVKGYYGDDTSSKVLGSEGCPLTCGTCSPNPCKDAPLIAKFANVPCVEAGSQAGIDVTPGQEGSLDPGLDPYPEFNEADMCTVNVHWHLGAEHRMEGQYEEACDFPHPGIGERRLAEEIRTGHMCCNAKEMYESNDALVANEFDWQYCKNMHVGLSYEFHWPHSNLGLCQTEWQLQYPFMDGVLCKATIGNLSYSTAVGAIGSGDARIGVEAQVFTIVNSEDPMSSPHLLPTWDAINGWDRLLADDIAYYIGSTTGDGANNEECRGTGGAVTWHVDRTCHLIEAQTVDNLCRMMLRVPTDDLSGDIYPHGARETVSDEWADSHKTIQREAVGM